MKDHNIIKKITIGFVVQEFNTQTGQWEHQEFVAGDQGRALLVDWENADGEGIDPPADESHLPFDMIQPSSEPVEPVESPLLDLEKYATDIVETWELDTLIEFAREKLIEGMKATPVNQLIEEYNEFYE